MSKATEALSVGAMARDDRRDRIGRVMDIRASRVWLRPPGGGREWEALRQDVRPVKAGESLGPRVTEANRRSVGAR